MTAQLDILAGRRARTKPIQLDPEAIAYIRSRGDRYPAGEGIDPEWTQEVMADVDVLALEPDPKSRMGASRFIGRIRPSRSDTRASSALVIAACRSECGLMCRGMPALFAIRATIRYTSRLVDRVPALGSQDQRSFGAVAATCFEDP